MKRRQKLVTVVLVALLLPAVVSFRALAANGAYGDGSYGSCTYNSCGISLSSNGTVNVNVIPGASTTCTVQSDSVGVTTDSSTGYTLTATTSTSSNSLASGGNTIPATGGTAGSPAALTANTWGYRVDGLGSFGAGPTSAVSNTGVPVVSFAAIPTSVQTPATLATSSSPADPAVTTTVWYGVCVNSAKVAGTYTNSVVYTAVVN